MSPCCAPAAVADPPTPAAGGAPGHDVVDLTGIADAVGITGNGRSRTVVDDLLAAAGAQLQEIPLAKLLENPDNPRRSVLDVDELAESIKAHGIVQAIVAVPAAVYGDDTAARAGAVVIVAGHRRWHAAKKAGRTTAPVHVREDLDRAAAHEVMLIENLHREDLTKFEEARGYAVLASAPHNLSQRQIAERVGVNQSHVSRMIAIAKLPDEVQQEVIAGEVPLQDAAEVAAAADDPEVFKRAWSKIWMGGKRAVDLARREVAQKQKQDETAEKLKARGIKTVKAAPARWRGANGTTELGVLQLTARDHQKEPCHAAYVEPNGSITYCCRKPENHRSEDNSSTAKSTSRPAPQDVEREQLEAAAAARVEVLRPFFKGRGPTGKSVTELQLRVQVDLCVGPTPAYADDAAAIALRLLGLEATDNKGSEELVYGLLDTKSRQLLAVVLAFAAFESRLTYDWNRRDWDANDAWYLELLETEYGYDLSEIEHAKLGHKRKGGMWTRPEPASS